MKEREDELADMKDVVTQIQNNIEKHHTEINECNDRIKDLQSVFFNAAKDNKYWDFLRRIFRKKYKPEKIRDLDGKC